MISRLKGLFKVQNMLQADLVQGELPSTKQAYRDVIDIALPSVMELVLISLINSVDMMMVGGCGADAIAAVGLVNQRRWSHAEKAKGVRPTETWYCAMRWSLYLGCRLS